jgi:hypothetical protein
MRRLGLSFGVWRAVSSIWPERAANPTFDAVSPKLRRTGVEADLQVYEGMSHGQYNFDPDAPETKEVFAEIARFFDAHLGK